MLGRSREEGWHPGWVSQERSEFSRILVVTESLSNKTLCTSHHQPLVCTHPSLRLHATVQESTWREGGLSWVHLPARSHSGLSLPSHHQVCVPGADDTHLGSARKRIYHLLMKILHHQTEPVAPDTIFPFPAFLWGVGPLCASCMVCLCLMTSLPSSPVHISLPSRSPMWCTFSPEESSRGPGYAYHASLLGVMWSFNSLCWHLTKLADFITTSSQLGCSSFSGLIYIIYIFRCSLYCILCFFKTPFWKLKI